MRKMSLVSLVLAAVVAFGCDGGGMEAGTGCTDVPIERVAGPACVYQTVGRGYQCPSLVVYVNDVKQTIEEDYRVQCEGGVVILLHADCDSTVVSVESCAR